MLQNLYNNSLQLKHFHPGHKLKSQYNSKICNLLFQRGTHNLPKGQMVILLLLLDHNSNDLQDLLHYQKTFGKIRRVKISGWPRHQTSMLMPGHLYKALHLTDHHCDKNQKEILYP